jgi:hypothetical protein
VRPLRRTCSSGLGMRINWKQTGTFDGSHRIFKSLIIQ